MDNLAIAEASRTWWIPRLTRWCCCPPLSKGLLTFRQCTSVSTVVIKLFFQARVSSEGELSLWTKESGLLSNHRKSLRVPTKPSWWQLLFGDEGINLWDPALPWEPVEAYPNPLCTPWNWCLSHHGLQELYKDHLDLHAHLSSRMFAPIRLQKNPLKQKKPQYNPQCLAI